MLHVGFLCLFFDALLDCALWSLDVVTLLWLCLSKGLFIRVASSQASTSDASITFSRISLSCQSAHCKASWAHAVSRLLVYEAPNLDCFQSGKASK